MILKQLLEDVGRYYKPHLYQKLNVYSKAGLNRQIRRGSGIVITSDVDIGLSKVCADWIDEQAPVMICDVEMRSQNLRNNQFNYRLVDCTEVVNGQVLTSCPARF